MLVRVCVSTFIIMEQARAKRRPTAHVFRVDMLLQYVEDGMLRVPDFQRPLRWHATNVLDLFDSIYRGIPIGSLLLFKGTAEEDSIHFGPYHVEAPAMADAYFVVDGQQRITSLVGAMLHPDPRPRGDLHAIWFDLEEERFVHSRQSEPPLHWIPLNVVGKPLALMKWFREWPFQNQRPELAERAIALGQTIRDYQIPAYIVEGMSEQELRHTFMRINTAGVPLDESEVFEALFSGKEPRPITSACARLQAETSFGEISPNWFLRCMKLVEGVDSWREVGEHPRAIESTERSLRRAINFLSEEAGIFHSLLLPYRMALLVLARFFHVHPQPHARTKTLLVRWIWREALSGKHKDSGTSHTVRGLQSKIDGSEFDSVERLLRTVPKQLSQFPTAWGAWHGHSAETRLCALAMAHMGPRDPETGEVLSFDQIRRLLNERTLASVFLPVGEGVASVARRLLLPTPDKLPRLLYASPEVLQSHALDAEALHAWERGDHTAFERHRGELLNTWFQRFFTERSAPNESDRPPVAELIRRVDAQVTRT